LRSVLLFFMVCVGCDPQGVPTAKAKRDARDRAPENRPSRGKFCFGLEVALMWARQCQNPKEVKRDGRGLVVFAEKRAEEKRSGNFTVARSVVLICSSGCLHSN